MTFNLSNEPDRTYRLTVIAGAACPPPTRIVEYQHGSHFAVFAYDGVNGSIDITQTLSDDEQDHIRGAMVDILRKDDDDFQVHP